MRNYLLATIWALAFLFVSTAHVVSGVPIASNQFENPPKLSAYEQRRISAGQHTDSPFGSGCVGTSNLCPLALSRADDTERETLHREAPPLLWKVLEDEKFQVEYQAATPRMRLRKFYERLGGENFEFKRQLSETELQRLLKVVEQQGELKRRGESAEQDHDRRTWRQMFAMPTPAPAASQSSARTWRSVFALPTPAPTVKPSQPQSSSRSRPTKTGQSTLRKRSFDDGSSIETTEQDADVKPPEQAEKDDFHAGLRMRYSRSWSRD